MEKLITNKFIVDEREIVEERFYKMTATNIDWAAVIDFVERNNEKAVFYFDNEMKRKKENEKRIDKVWIDTGYETADHEAIFLSLVKYEEYYSGHYVGTAKFLMSGNQSRYFNNKAKNNFRAFLQKYKQVKAGRINTDSTQDYIEEASILTAHHKENSIGNTSFEAVYQDGISKTLSEVTTELFNNLLFPGWKSIEGLDSYIKTIGRRISQLVEDNRTEYYVVNNLGSVVVNTGLLDPFGNDYMVMYRKYCKTESYVAYKVMTGKTDYINESFSLEQSLKELRPISFMDKNEENAFSPRIEDFDINMRCLSHIINERIHRFPENLQQCSTEYLAQNVIQALKQALKIQERDSSYVRPIYSNGRISWLFPLRVGAQVTDDPELVMVIRKSDSFYELKTILPYNDDVKDKITAASLYRKMW